MQVLWESIKTKTIPKQKSPKESPSNIHNNNLINSHRKEQTFYKRKWWMRERDTFDGFPGSLKSKPNGLPKVVPTFSRSLSLPSLLCAAKGTKNNKRFSIKTSQWKKQKQQKWSIFSNTKRTWETLLVASEKLWTWIGFVYRPCWCKEKEF